MYCIEKLISRLGSCVTYILLFIFNPGHKWKEVTSGKLDSSCADEKILPRYYDECIIENKDLFLQQQDRLSSNNDKCDTILKISSFLFAAQIAIVTWKNSSLFLLLPMFFTACSIFLVLMRDRVGIVKYVSKKQLFNQRITKKQIKKKIIEDFQQVLYHNDCVINFKIGIYSAARRILIISVFLTILLMTLLIFFNRPSENSEKSSVDIINVFISI